MTIDQITIIILLLIILAAGYIGYVLFDLRKKFLFLFPKKGKAKDLSTELTQRLAQAEKTIKELTQRTEILEKIGQIAVQKIGFKRFNPFADTGGDNSFALALLDHKSNGVIISSLYTREGVRIYAKKIETGLSKQPLSKEEKEVMEEAISQNSKS